MRRLIFAGCDADLATLLRRYFEGIGFEVATAADVTACMAQVAANDPAILVVDEEVPGGADRLIAAAGWWGIDVVVLSHFEPCGSLKPPVVACLHKPFRLKVLLDQVLQSCSP